MGEGSTLLLPFLLPSSDYLGSWGDWGAPAREGQPACCLSHLALGRAHSTPALLAPFLTLAS